MMGELAIIFTPKDVTPVAFRYRVFRLHTVLEKASASRDLSVIRLVDFSMELLTFKDYS